MDEPVRWVSKAEVAQEMEVSLSTLDRKIRKEDVEVVREGRRGYVRMHGPEYLSDDELLRRAIAREDELERTVRQLERSASELERERDEARDTASVREDGRTRSLRRRIARSAPCTEGRDVLAIRLGMAVAVLFVLMVISVVVAWRLLT